MGRDETRLRPLRRDLAAGYDDENAAGKVADSISLCAAFLLRTVGPDKTAEFFERMADQIRAAAAAGEFEQEGEHTSASSTDDQST